jgi:hypothetical protein
MFAPRLCVDFSPSQSICSANRLVAASAFRPPETTSSISRFDFEIANLCDRPVGTRTISPNQALEMPAQLHRVFQGLGVAHHPLREARVLE